MWLKEIKNHPIQLVIKKEEKKDWLKFFIENFELNTLKNNNFDLFQQLQGNFFQYHKLTKANKSFVKLSLLLMLEQKIDIKTINWKSFFKNLNTDPKKILLLSYNHSYCLVKESAIFLNEFNPLIHIDLNNLPDKRYLDSSFNTELFNLFLLESQKKFQYFVEDNKNIIKDLNDNNKDTSFEIHTEPLMNWHILKQFTKNEFGVKLFCSLIEKNVIHSSLITKDLDGKEQTLFESLLLKPTNYNSIILETLFNRNIDDFNLEEAFIYCKQKLDFLLQSFSNTNIPNSITSIHRIVKNIELAKINRDLTNNLKRNEDGYSGKITKV